MGEHSARRNRLARNAHWASTRYAGTDDGHGKTEGGKMEGGNIGEYRVFVYGLWVATFNTLIDAQRYAAGRPWAHIYRFNGHGLVSKGN